MLRNSKQTTAAWELLDPFKGKMMDVPIVARQMPNVKSFQTNRLRARPLWDDRASYILLRVAILFTSPSLAMIEPAAENWLATETRRQREVMTSMRGRVDSHF